MSGDTRAYLIDYLKIVVGQSMQHYLLIYQPSTSNRHNWHNNNYYSHDNETGTL